MLILTDHTAVKWLMNKIDVSGRHARWQVILSEFDYVVRSRPGSKNGNADAMLRLTGKEPEEEIDDEPAHLALRATVLRA